MIKPDTNKTPPPIFTKYRLEMKYLSPDGDLTTMVLNINADVAVKSFYSKEADNGHSTLVVTYNDLADDCTGFARFNGNVGAGTITITLESGVKITGDIVGGPKEKQSFVGTGTWTMS